MNIAANVREIAEPVTEAMGIDLIDVEYVKEGSKWILRLYIDKKGGVGLDDCENVSRAVEPLIDEADPIKNEYVFEVSSPGLDRPLKTDRDFERYEGEDVELSLYAPVNGVKQFSGVLLGRTDGIIRIRNDREEELEFSQKDVSLVKRTIKW